MNVKMILFLIVFGLAIVFIVQNVSAVTVNIFFWKISLSLALLVFFLLVIGFGIGWFLHSFLAYRKVKKEVSDIQAEMRSAK